MKRATLILVAILITVTFVSCDSSIHSYHCKECNLSFKIEEANDSIDVMTFSSGDSIFFTHCSNGNYMSYSFCLLQDSDVLYLKPHSSLVRFVEKKYRIVPLQYDIDKATQDEPYKGYEYWSFDGGCDQGSYTFSVFHDSTYIKCLEPLEWE